MYSTLSSISEKQNPTSGSSSSSATRSRPAAPPTSPLRTGGTRSWTTSTTSTSASSCGASPASSPSWSACGPSPYRRSISTGKEGEERKLGGWGGYRLRIPETRWAEHSQSRVCVCRLDPDLEIDTGSFCFEGPPKALPPSVQGCILKDDVVKVSV